jgi:hypothetical protein
MLTGLETNNKAADIRMAANSAAESFYSAPHRQTAKPYARAPTAAGSAVGTLFSSPFAFC